MFRTIPAGYTSFEHVLRPEVDPGPEATFVCAHEFKLVGGEGGYLGLVTRDDALGMGRSAVLAIWEAVGADGPGAVTMGGDRPGWTCRVPYPWEEGRAYAMQVWTGEPGWWSAVVRDESTGIETPIGNIQVPPGWRRLASWSMMLMEYGGELSRCHDLPPARVTFSAPTADDGTVEPQRHESSLGPGTCDSSRVEDVPGGVRHEMGLA